MRKLLIVLFLLLITSISVVGFVSTTETDAVKIEQEQPVEPNSTRVTQ